MDPKRLLLFPISGEEDGKDDIGSFRCFPVSKLVHFIELLARFDQLQQLQVPRLDHSVFMGSSIDHLKRKLQSK